MATAREVLGKWFARTPVSRDTFKFIRKVVRCTRAARSRIAVDRLTDLHIEALDSLGIRPRHGGW